MSLCWKGDQNHFAVSYSNGLVLTYSCRNKSKLKAKSKISPHHGDTPHSISPCNQVKYFNRGSNSWVLFSGGYPEGRTLGVRALTIYNEKSGADQKPYVLSFIDPINCFLTLSPGQMFMGKFFSRPSCEGLLESSPHKLVPFTFFRQVVIGSSGRPHQ